MISSQASCEWSPFLNHCSASITTGSFLYFAIHASSYKPPNPSYRLGMSDDSRTQFRSGPGLMHLQPLQRAESPHVQRALIVTGIPLDSDWAKSHGATSLAMSSPSARSAS